MRSILVDWFDWAYDNFGPGVRTESVLSHIEKEIQEVREASSDEDIVGEFLDIAVLSLDGAIRILRKTHGIEGESFSVTLELERLLDKKLYRNKARRWPDWRQIPEGQPIEHIREED